MRRCFVSDAPASARPRRPLPLKPHAHTSPSFVSASVWNGPHSTWAKWAPAEIALIGRGVSEFIVSPWPSLPYEPPPHV